MHLWKLCISVSFCVTYLSAIIPNPLIISSRNVYSRNYTKSIYTDVRTAIRFSTVTTSNSIKEMFDSAIHHSAKCVSLCAYPAEKKTQNIASNFVEFRNYVYEAHCLISGQELFLMKFRRETNPCNLG